MVNTVWSSTLSTTMQPCGYTLWCVCIEECDYGAEIANGVWLVVDGDEWHLWLLPWLCHPHMCLFVIHHKSHTHSHILLQKSIWRPRRPGDLPSCIGWVFGDHSSSNAIPTTPFPLFLLLQPSFLVLSTCLCHSLGKQVLVE